MRRCRRGVIRTARRSRRIPAEMIRIGRLDYVRSFAGKNFADRAQIKEDAITAAPWHQGRRDRIDMRPRRRARCRVPAGDNQHMLVLLAALLDEMDLLLQIPFHAAAARSVELREVADFHRTWQGTSVPLAVAPNAFAAPWQPKCFLPSQ